MLKYYYNIFFDCNTERLPGKGIFLSVANEDELAAKRNAEDMQRMAPHVKHLGLISCNIKEEWRLK